MSNKLRLKKEFINLMAPLQPKAYKELEEFIRVKGCQNAIEIWGDYVIDGYNQYAICEKYNIKFPVVSLDFGSDEEAIVYICRKQLKRHDLTLETRKFLIGMQFVAEKLLATGTYEDDCEIEEAVFSSRKVAQRIGNENHVSHTTVVKYAEYTRALKIIGSKESTLLPKILSGMYRISHNQLIEMSKMSSTELSKISERMTRSTAPLFKVKSMRNVMQPSSPSGTLQQTSIKDMPSFDPDAPITELTLTIPSWISSIRRSKANTDFSLITNAARKKLIFTLSELDNAVLDMKETIEENTNGL